MKNLIKIYLLIASLTLIPINSQATTITYQSMNLSGNTWQNTYEVFNDSLSFAIDEFAIYFDLHLYKNLSLVNIDGNWDPLLLQPDPVIPDDGLFDAYGLFGGILPGNSLGGFTIQFDWLGIAAIPEEQFFEIFDPTNFNSLDSGFTELVSVIQPPKPRIPEPPIYLLMAVGLFSLLGRKYRAKTYENI